MADKDFATVIHPMVFTHAETKRKILNLSPWFAQGIVGMDDEEAGELLTAVIAHCLSDPALSYFHDWEAGDMVLWDNWRMLHSCTGVAPSDRRLLTRTTMLGDYGFGRLQDSSAALDLPVKISV